MCVYWMTDFICHISHTKKVTWTENTSSKDNFQKYNVLCSDILCLRTPIVPYRQVHKAIFIVATDSKF